MKKFSCFLVLLFLSQISHALTRGDIRSIIRRHIGDVATPEIHHTNLELNNYINEAQRDVANVTWGVGDTESVTLVAGTTSYTLTSANAMAIRRVRFNAKPLTETTIEELDRTKPGWQSVSGIPTNYFFDDTYPAQMFFYPAPSTATGATGTATVYKYSFPTDMTSDTSVPWGSANLRMQAYQDLIVYFVCYRVFLLEGKGDKATVYRNEYESRLVVMRERIGSKPNYNPGFSGNQNR